MQEYSSINKYVVREIEIKGSPEVVILDCYDNQNKDIWRPSRLTDFIYKEYMNNALNTKLKAARAVTGFMNYICKEVNLGEDEAFRNLNAQGLYGLKFTHLAKYLNDLSKSSQNSKQTIKDKENVLLKFYDFLYKSKITKEKVSKKVGEITTTSSTGTHKTKRGKQVIISPFEDKHKYQIKYPSEKKGQKIRQDLKYEIWTQMLEYAEHYYPQIAFGFAIQCMGGLRQGEVVNLNRDDVTVVREDNILLLNIQPRPELLADRKIKKKKSQLKKDKPAEQMVFNFNNRLFEMYENHLKYIDKHASKEAIKLKGLFIDFNGKCMSGDTYESTFRKLKKDFIEKVRKYSEATASDLSMDSWGSHIGRHVFTNYLIKTGAIDDITGIPDDDWLSLLRRDRHSESARVYIDKKILVQNINQVINKLSQAAKY